MVIFCFFIISLVWDPPIPDASYALNEMMQEPIQKKTNRKRFLMKKFDKNYFIEPMYDYELWGIVVTYPNMHSLFDPKNIKYEVREKDFCIIWGKNIKNNIHKNTNFSSSNYTCHVRPKKLTDRNWGKDFHINQLSNNHLLTDKKDIAKTIAKIEIGDQIYIKGVLMRYGDEELGYVMRESSTTRNDYKCETIYIDEIKILKKSTTIKSFFLNMSEFFWLIIFLIKIFINLIFKAERKKIFANKNSGIRVPTSSTLIYAEKYKKMILKIIT